MLSACFNHASSAMPNYKAKENAYLSVLRFMIYQCATFEIELLFLMRSPSRFAVLLLAGAAAAHATSPQTFESHVGMLRVTVALQNGRFGGLSVRDKVSGRSLYMKEAFVVVWEDGTMLRSTQMDLAPISDSTSVVDPQLTRETTSKKRCIPSSAAVHSYRSFTSHPHS